MSEFKPNQPKSIPAKKLIGFGAAFLACAIITIWMIIERDTFASTAGFVICLLPPLAGAIITPIMVNRMQKDYRNGRSR